jgi:hypothetical protein
MKRLPSFWRVLVAGVLVALAVPLLSTVGDHVVTWWKTRRFAEAEAKVTASHPRTERLPRGGAVTIPEVEFDYTVEGHAYHGDNRYDRTGGDRFDAKKVTDAHPIGQALTVYYDPEHPETAVMSRDVPILGQLGHGIIGLLAVVGAWGVLTGDKKRR